MQSWSVTATASVAHFSVTAATLEASAGAADWEASAGTALRASAGASALSACDAPMADSVAFVEAGAGFFSTGAATAGLGPDASHAADVMALFEPHVAAGGADG
jgi:hypothetical protein